jgi:hypothetical protein
VNWISDFKWGAFRKDRPETDNTGSRFIPPPPLICLELKSRGKGTPARDRKLNLSPTVVDRLLSLTHASRIEQIETALAALGKKLVVGVREAA